MVESFDPDQVRPWRYHNRAGSGMDEPSLGGLADAIRRDGQQQLGLARRLPPNDNPSGRGDLRRPPPRGVPPRRRTVARRGARRVPG